MKIRDKEVDGYVVAELGTAFAALSEARRMALLSDLIARAEGVDAVKVQMFVPEEPLFCPVEGDDKRWTRWGQSILCADQWAYIRAMCHKRGLAFIASVFQPGGIEMGKRVGLDAWKVATRANRTFPLHEVGGPVVMSSRPLDEVERPKNGLLLHCMGLYPTPLIHARYNKNWADGLSDHSGTPWPAIDALARGAEMVEVHFGDTSGPDAKVCVSRDELRMICDARDAFREMRQG